MSQKTKASLTSTLNLAITDQVRQENTSVRVRALQQDIIDSLLNTLDGGSITGGLSATTLFVGGSAIYPVSIPINEIAIGNGSSLISSPNFNLSGVNSFVNIAVRSMGDQSWNGINIHNDSDEQNQGNLFRYHTTQTGQVSGTSIDYADLLELNNRLSGTDGEGVISVRGLPVYNIANDSALSRSTATRLDGNGFRIADASLIHTANTFVFEAGALTVDANTIYSAGTDLGVLFGGNSAYLPTNQIGFGNSLSALTGSSNLTFVEGGSYSEFTTRYGGAYYDIYINGSSSFVESSGALSIRSVAGSIQLQATVNVTSLTNTGTTRLVEVSSGGTLSATKEVINAYGLNSTIQGYLEDVSNWDAVGVYTGSTITGTYQGQKHYDANYLFEAVADNYFIRLIRA